MFGNSRGIFRSPHEHTRIVVDTEKVNRGGDDGEIVFSGWWRSNLHIGEKTIRVAPAKERIEEPAIAEDIGMFNCTHGFGPIIGGVDGIEVERNAYLRLGRKMRAHTWHREP